MSAAWIDVLLLIGFGLWLQFTYSKAASIVILAYSIINMIYLFVETGRLGGYFMVVAGVLALINTSKLKKEYESM